MRELTCERCGRRFGCGVDTGSCWCADVTVDPARLAGAGDDCLCPACLGVDPEPDLTRAEASRSTPSDGRGGSGRDGEAVTERRRSSRAAVTLPCTLCRRTGSAIDARTLEVGTGGMRASTGRPLALDEVVSFDLALEDEVHVTGRARVMRQEGHSSYALRFEELLESERRRLEVIAASRAREAGVSLPRASA